VLRLVIVRGNERSRQREDHSLAIQPCPLPEPALLRTYARNGSYTDCFATTVDRDVSLEQYVAAFYTTWVFKLERVILKWAVARPSTDAQAAQLAAGTLADFAAWRVERRAPDQLLLCDFMGRTRSWLMVAPHETGTRLYFGSAVVPRAGQASIGPGFNANLGFHKLYSRVLLHAAARRLRA
jgi:hypothetical protein